MAQSDAPQAAGNGGGFILGLTLLDAIHAGHGVQCIGLGYFIVSAYRAQVGSPSRRVWVIGGLMTAGAALRYAELSPAMLPRAGGQ